ncbi:MAG: hypothetical protein K0R51_704 [Cytophagaceae bacterium]|nr:hypothetical protein [Cytophagaceae bacterium]
MLFEKTKILSVTKNYMDSCTTNKVEIGSIYYMKAVENCGFESNELNYEEINSNSLLGFYFEKGAIIGIKVFNGSSDKLFKINGHKVTEE